MERNLLPLSGLFPPSLFSPNFTFSLASVLQDMSRLLLPVSEPRTRMDAGTWGTMGLGLGSAIAAAVVHPDRRVHHPHAGRFLTGDDKRMGEQQARGGGGGPLRVGVEG